MNFSVLWLFAKVFSAKFWGVPYFGVAKAKKSVKVFSANSLQTSYFSPICESFLPRKFPAVRYV